MATFGRGIKILQLSSRFSAASQQRLQRSVWCNGASIRAASIGSFERHDTSLGSTHKKFYHEGRSEFGGQGYKKYSGYAAVAAVSFGFGLACYLMQREPEQVAQCAKADAPTAGRRNPKLKDYRKADIRAHNSKKTGMWVTFNEGVYDITEFVQGHPGGDKILLAAGGSLEPFWQMYSVHKNPQVYEVLEELRIGNIHPDDMAELSPKKDAKDPYSSDPIRHPALRINSPAPFNAETPPQLLTDNFYTPNELFFVRNHLPVPHVDVKKFVLEIKVPGQWRNLKLSIDDLKKKFKVHTISAAIQCAGNRRSHMAAESKPVKGLSWGMTAISNAEWTGVKLSDVLAWAGVNEDEVEHIIFQGEDKDMEGHPYEASIPAGTALDPRREVLIAFAMNGEDLPLDHGYPLRLVVPGSVGARQVKWLNKIIPSKTESDSHHQQQDYKTFTPSTDWSTVDWSKAVAIQDYPIQSAITEPVDGATIEGDEVSLKGYAWSGGGRGIVRVEVSADGGKTWHEAELHTVKQKYNRQWAWTLWEATIKLPEEVVKNGSKTKLMCKAIDSSHNQQPESAASIWNLRGLIHNAWHKIEVAVDKD